MLSASACIMYLMPHPLSLRYLPWICSVIGVAIDAQSSAMSTCMLRCHRKLKVALFADGMWAIKSVLSIILGPESVNLSLAPDLHLQPSCSPAQESACETVLTHPRSKLKGYVLQHREAAVLAYCWSNKFFAEDCETYIFEKLRRSLLPDAAFSTELLVGDADSAVAKLLQCIKTCRWKPGWMLPEAIEKCFPSDSAGAVLTTL